ncbi:MAG TPA: TetR/AcrR family transcriptional regulator [Pseudolabrys sp.]
MPRDPNPTRNRIVEAASKLFYGEGIRSVSIDAVAAKAGLTKRTLYYHFKSKDDLIAAYLEARDAPNLAVFAKWFQQAKGPLPAKIETIFKNLAQSARHPKWKGCGFLRTAAELAAMPGHPAIKVGAKHKSAVEAWLAGIIAADGRKKPDELAQQIVILMDGAFSTMLIHRDPIYIEAAGRAAAALVGTKK